MSRLRNDFFRLKPADDGHRSSSGGGGENLLEKMDLSNMFYDSSREGATGGGAGKVFRLSFDVSQFRPEEISITTHDQRLVVHAKHEGKSTPCTIFFYRATLPASAVYATEQGSDVGVGLL